MYPYYWTRHFKSFFHLEKQQWYILEKSISNKLFISDSFNIDHCHNFSLLFFFFFFWQLLIFVLSKLSISNIICFNKFIGCIRYYFWNWVNLKLLHSETTNEIRSCIFWMYFQPQCEEARFPVQQIPLSLRGKSPSAPKERCSDLAKFALALLCFKEEKKKRKRFFKHDFSTRR